MNLGLVSLVSVVVGAAALAACSSDDNDTMGVGGESGAHAGSAGKSGAASGGGDKGGSAGASAGNANGGNGGSTTSGGAGHEAGAPPGGESGGGAAGANEGGMGGEAGGAALLHTPSAAVKTLSPLPALPAETTNQYADNAGAATLGQKLFFDKRYSGALKVAGPLGAVGDTGKIACATCHSGPAMSDNRDPLNVTLGTDFHTRNAPALVNSSFYQWTNWAGRFARQWELPLAVAENGVTMNSNRLKLAHFIYDTYKVEYEAVFGAIGAPLTDTARFPANGKPKATAADVDGPWEGMAIADRTVVNRIIVNFGKALQAYSRKLVSRDAPFDKYVAGDHAAISESAKRGAELFVGKAKCNACHSGPFFTDDKFHNLGVRQDSSVAHEPASDDGRFKDAATLVGSALNASGTFSDDPAAGATQLTGLTNPMTDLTTKAAFRTASLREVGDTKPYMHSGQLATLADVVSFYVAGGGTVAAGTTKDPLLTPIALDAGEQLDLIAFLKTLSGAPIPAPLLVDTSGQ